MIDWVTAELPLSHFPLNGGSVCKTDREGVIEWETSCFLSSVGSFDSSIQYKSSGGDGQGMATKLVIHGNPAKYLQGHNVFGSDDLLSLVLDAYLKICAGEGITPKAADLEAVRLGYYSLRRLDVNRSFSLPTQSDVNAWLRAAEYSSKTRHGRPSMKGGTLYWGKHSKRWSIKGYSKWEEMNVKKKGHALPRELHGTPLLEWANNKLRIELVIRGKQLDEHNINQGHLLSPQIINGLFDSYLRKITMSSQVKLADKALQNLPRALHSTYTLWKEGNDMRSLLTPATYYRHRAALLTDYNIDIALHQKNCGQSNVVPLVRILEAKPAEIPEWAFELGLIHSSARNLYLAVA